MSDIRSEARPTTAAIDAPHGGVSRRVLAVAITVLLTTLAAYAEVPMPGGLVPVTLQSLVVILAGVMLGPALGASAMVAYVGLGAAGAPVFAGGAGGFAHLFGPTGGYLLAFPAAAAAAGVIAGPVRRGAVANARLLAALAVASLVVFAGGVPYLAFYTGSVGNAIAVGFTPFVLGSVLKLIVAFAVAFRMRERTLRLL